MTTALAAYEKYFLMAANKAETSLQPKILAEMNITEGAMGEHVFLPVKMLGFKMAQITLQLEPAIDAVLGILLLSVLSLFVLFCSVSFIAKFIHLASLSFFTMLLTMHLTTLIKATHSGVHRQRDRETQHPHPHRMHPPRRHARLRPTPRPATATSTNGGFIRAGVSDGVSAGSRASSISIRD